MFPTPEDASERRDAVVTGVLQDVSDRLTSSVQNDPFSPGHRVEVVRGENDKAIVKVQEVLKKLTEWEVALEFKGDKAVLYFSEKE